MNVIDIETTGLRIERDRIVQISIVRAMGDVTIGDVTRGHVTRGDVTRGDVTRGHVPLLSGDDAFPQEAGMEVFTRIVDPAKGGFAAEDWDRKAIEVHGISPESVTGYPGFGEIAEEVLRILSSDRTIAGFNLFGIDLPILSREMRAAGYPLPALSSFRVIDAGVIFKRMERRTLEAAFRFYCGGELRNAHDAGADAMATAMVLEGQRRMYGFTPDDLEANSMYDGRIADYDGKLIYDNEGALRFNFGKYRGKLVCEEPDYAEWMLRQYWIGEETKELLIVNG